ncbi:MAG: SUMF1/EgtB/PvdO family nonheme iron enzyme [Acidobacteriota bacterium]
MGTTLTSITAALRKQLPETILDHRGHVMTLVPPGDYSVGAPGMGSDALEPRVVELRRPLYVDVRPASVAQVRDFLDSPEFHDADLWPRNRVSSRADLERRLHQGGTNAPDDTARGLTWHEASAYCAWCKKRLLLETEWEIAAQDSWSRRDGLSRIVSQTRLALPEKLLAMAQTGEITVSRHGCFSMLAGVFEWCSNSDADDPERRVARGVPPSTVLPPHPWSRTVYPTSRSAGMGVRGAVEHPTANESS